MVFKVQQVLLAQQVLKGPLEQQDPLEFSVQLAQREVLVLPVGVV
jgi:hypothetical protein